MSDDRHPGSKPPHLLDELRSIKNLLNSRDAVDDSIPLLRDVVSPGGRSLYDVESIFDYAILNDASCELVSNASGELAGKIPRDDDAGSLPDSRSMAFALAQPVGTAIHERGREQMVAAVAGSEATANDDYHRDLLIQEVIDEFIPKIEAALRERLRRLDNETLRRWLLTN